MEYKNGISGTTAISSWNSSISLSFRFMQLRLGSAANIVVTTAMVMTVQLTLHAS